MPTVEVYVAGGDGGIRRLWLDGTIVRAETVVGGTVDEKLVVRWTQVLLSLKGK